MKDKLIDVSIKTMVGQLPQIITQNNEIIENTFDSIYDDQKSILILPKIDTTKSNIDKTQQYVKTYTGIFKNVQTDILTVNSSANFKDKLNHNDLNNRYIGENIPESLETYMHNAESIGVVINNDNGINVMSLQEILNQYVLNKNSQSDQSNNTDQIYGITQKLQNNILVEPESYTFEDNVLFATNTQLKHMNLLPYQYNDIKGGYLYTYYDYNNVLTISDNHTASIKGLPGKTVQVKLNDTKSKAFYRIILSRKENKFLRVSKDELVRLSLICINDSEEYGTEWDVLNYSIRHAEDLIIERK